MKPNASADAQAPSHAMKVLLLVAGELVFAIIALPLYWFLVLPNHPEGELPGFSPIIAESANPLLAVLATLGVLIVALALVLALAWLFGTKHFKVPEFTQLLDESTNLDLVLIYAAAGFAEEFLFRTVLVDLCGLVIASLLFTAIHVAYWKKPLLLVDVFLLALLLGALWLYTESLLLCAIAHAAYNLIVSISLKEGVVSIQ